MAEVARTFKAIVDAVLLNRFTENDRGEAQRWVTAEYQTIWNDNDFGFKHVSAMDPAYGTLAIVANQRTPAMPATFAELEELLDDRGTVLEPLSPQQFSRFYRGLTNTGRPECFTVVNRQIYLGPTPAAAATFFIGYRRLLSYLDTTNGNAVVAGNMAADTDAPMWYPSGSSEVLIAGGRARGKRRRQDPTATADALERDELLDALIADFAPDNSAKAEYPRDRL